jgi:NAD(P)-dependent dehydrogenase (short-subunit alcohol dehydrogenase family)
MTVDLTARVILISGAASGLGRAIALRVARAGGLPVVGDVDGAGSRRTVELIESAGATADQLTLDVADPTSVQLAVEQLTDTYGERFDGLVNNAGIDRGASVLDITTQQWDQVVAVNQTGPLLLAQAFLRSLQSLPRPRLADIVNVVSISAITVGTDAAAYNSSKAALAMLTRILQREVLDYGWPVRVHGLMPSAMNTPMMDQWHLADEVMMDPDTVARAVEFMLTLPTDSYVQNLVINSRREPNWPR